MLGRPVAANPAPDIGPVQPGPHPLRARARRPSDNLADNVFGPLSPLQRDNTGVAHRPVLRLLTQLTRVPGGSGFTFPLFVRLMHFCCNSVRRGDSCALVHGVASS